MGYMTLTRLPLVWWLCVILCYAFFDTKPSCDGRTDSRCVAACLLGTTVSCTKTGGGSDTRGEGTLLGSMYLPHEHVLFFIGTHRKMRQMHQNYHLRATISVLLRWSEVLKNAFWYLSLRHFFWILFLLKQSCKRVHSLCVKLSLLQMACVAACLSVGHSQPLLFPPLKCIVTARAAKASYELYIHTDSLWPQQYMDVVRSRYTFAYKKVFETTTFPNCHV